MEIKQFSKEVAALMPEMHAEFFKRQPRVLMKGRLSFAQMVLLDILRAKKESNMGEIAKSLGVTKGAVTGLADRLIAVKLVKRTRSKSDRRIVNVHLTTRGIRMAKTLCDFKLKITANLFMNISPKERDSYLMILRKLHDNIVCKKNHDEL